MNLDPQVLRSEQHVEVGQVIQRDAGILITRWSQRAVQEQPNAARAHHQALLDHLPRLLQTLGQSLAESHGANGSPHQAPAREHGEQRWEVGWSLPEVVRDYQILRLVLFEYLEETLHRPLHFREIMAIGLALDEAIAASVVAYVRQTESSLREQTASLKEADQRKNDFLAILAHELRNPLAPILTSIEMFRLIGSGDVHLSRGREIVERQVKHMVRLIDDLLDLTRIAQGKVEIAANASMGQAVNQAVQTVRPLFDSQGHQSVCRVARRADPAGSRSGADGAGARQSAHQRGQVYRSRRPDRSDGEPRRRRGDAARARHRRRHRDGHAGPHLRPVHAGGPIAARAQGGLGIGLTLVRQIVELHGGRVSVHSDGAGKGSEFTVRLPVAPAAPRRPRPPAPVGQLGVPQLAAPSCHILIIEDNADARETLTLLLQMLGHRTETASTGPDGVDLALAAGRRWSSSIWAYPGWTASRWRGRSVPPWAKPCSSSP